MHQLLSHEKGLVQHPVPYYGLWLGAVGSALARLQMVACVGLLVGHTAEASQKAWNVGANASRVSVPWLAWLSPQHPKMVLQAALLLQNCP